MQIETILQTDGIVVRDCTVIYRVGDDTLTVSGRCIGKPKTPTDLTTLRKFKLITGDTEQNVTGFISKFETENTLPEYYTVAVEIKMNEGE